MVEIIFTRKAHVAGHSLVVTIPPEICKAFEIEDKTDLEITTLGDQIILRKKE